MRRAPAEIRKLEPDSIYRSVLVSQLINKVLWRGKKGAARRIVYGAMDTVEQRTGSDPLPVLKRAIDNIRPALEVRSRRVGGSSYQVPVEVRPRRREALARRWLVGAARDRSEKTMAERLAGEFMSAAKGEGAAVRKKQDVHRMAEANKAFAHYRW